MAELFFPGDVLALCDEFTPGAGTHVSEGKICASVIGRLTKTPQDNTIIVSIHGHRKNEAGQAPKKNDLVLCRITKLAKDKASADILSINKETCAYPLHSTITNTAATKDEANPKITACFRPGDLVVGRVIGQSSAVFQEGYLLRTDEPALGVTVACSALTGNVMTAISQTRMLDPQTKIEEKRKCVFSK